MAQFSLSARIERIEPSATIAMSARSAALKAAGKDVINLTTGEPDFDTPEHIKDAARKALANGETKYTAVAGTIALREAICRKLARDSGLDYKPDDVIATCGAKHAIMNLFLVAADHGDEVVIPTPCWVTYPDVATFCGAKPVYVDASHRNGFKIEPEQLEEALSDRTRIFVINSPSNPTGAVYGLEELRALGEVLEKYPKVIIASDEIYEHITYGDAKFASFPEACPDLKDRTVIFNGVSKAYAMTGWRVGFSASHPDLAKAMRKIQSQTTTNICSISQAAAVAAFDSELDNLKPMLEAFGARRAKVLQAFDGLEGVAAPAIDGAFYAFIEVGGAARQLAADGVIKDPSDQALAEHLLSEKLVSTVYGSAFKSQDPALRLSFATSDELLAEGLERLRSALA